MSLALFSMSMAALLSALELHQRISPPPSHHVFVRVKKRTLSRAFYFLKSHSRESIRILGIKKSCWCVKDNTYYARHRASTGAGETSGVVCVLPMT